MAHRSEQGNVLGFVLVGVLLAALLAGGIYAVRRGMLAKVTDGATGTVATTENANKDSKTDGASASTDKKDSKTDGDSTKTADQKLKEALTTQSAEEKKAQEQQKAQQNAAVADSSAKTEDSTKAESSKKAETSSAQDAASSNKKTTTATTADTPSQASSSTAAAALPTTGPEDAILPVAGAALLAGIGLSYFHSRKLI